MWYVFLTCKKVHLQWNSFLKLEPFWQSCSAKKKKKDKNSQSVNPEIIIRQSGLVTGSPGQSVAASFFCSLIQTKQFKPQHCANCQMRETHSGPAVLSGCQDEEATWGMKYDCGL